MSITEANCVSMTKTVFEELLPPLVDKAVEDAVDRRMGIYHDRIVSNIDSEINKAIRKAVGQYFFQVEARVREIA